MDNNTQNLILAVVLSMLILVIYQIYLAPPLPDPSESGYSGQTTESLAPPAEVAGQLAQTQDDEVIPAPRLPISTSQVEGSLSLAGGRIDDLKLLNYAQDHASDNARVALLRPSETADSYFAEVIFLDANGARLIDKDAIWQASTRSLTPNTPLTLTHTNDEGITFRLTYAIDESYLITMTARAENASGRATAIRPFARIRRNLPSVSEFFISYEGPLGVFAEGQKTEIGYDDAQAAGTQGEVYKIQDDINGWIGITDKYWLTAFIPAPLANNQQDFSFGFRQAARTGEATQVDVDAIPHEVANGATLERKYYFYAGPKKVNILLDYSEQLGVERLDHAIDWGWFPFLTKPFFHALNWLYNALGNFGLAIMALTVAVKLAFFPLANKSYHSMAKMRTLAPKIKELRETFADDKQRQQQAMMELYRQEKVNPAAGCLPILLQIPVFFALYKVLFVTIEMRHAPFYGWITDLSALDPTSIINLFGLLPFSTAIFPDFINLGIWPILMGITMYIQMALNPPPPDPIQARIFKFMPLFFTFLLATFPAGLVIYWTWNNVLSIIQQWYIMRSVDKQNA